MISIKLESTMQGKKDPLVVRGEIIHISLQWEPLVPEVDTSVNRDSVGKKGFPILFVLFSLSVSVHPLFHKWFDSNSEVRKPVRRVLCFCDSLGEANCSFSTAF
jgi:hypothetical protein